MPERLTHSALASLATAMALGACATTIDGVVPPVPEASVPAATVRLTEYGVPHMRAPDYAGLGRGYGYVFAEQNLCMAADLFLSLRGERSKYLGADGVRLDVFAGAGFPTPTPVPNPLSDIYFKATYSEATAAAMEADASEAVRGLTSGFVAGYNEFLAQTPPEERPEACRGAEWVLPITEADLYNRYRLLALLETSHVLSPAIASAQPPSAPQEQATLDLTYHRDEPIAGSNVIAFGQDATDFDGSFVFGNPHFPWFGENRLNAFHLRYEGGDYDVFGSSSYGFPFHNIGFNEDLAWSVTFSTDTRAVIYALELDPSDPTRYMIDGAYKDMTQTSVEIDMTLPDGTLTSQTRTLYETDFGPLITFGPFNWTDTQAFALFDVNSRMNAEVIARLKDKYRCISFDWRSQGRSGHPLGGHDVDMLARDGLALLDHLSIQAAHWVGVSIGGVVGVRLAAEFGDRVRSLILMGATSEKESLAKLERYEQVIGLHANDPVAGADALMPILFGSAFLGDPSLEATRAAARASIEQTDAERMARAITPIIRRTDIQHLLAYVRCPTLIVVGAEDGANGPDRASVLRAGIAGASLEILPGVGHSPPIEAPDSVAELIGAFVERG
ncbi:MAG: alpha/beta fold hydrolase [Hyphomonadaceae bacterium]|nr:alpha/beta fold hydrolase [Hyphomonadaceae bacterium]